MMKLVLALLFCSTLSAAAQEKPAAPQIQFCGTLESTAGKFAVVRSPKQTYVCKEGESLGDYQLTEVGNRKITFTYKEFTYPFSLTNTTAAPHKTVEKRSDLKTLPQKGVVQMEVADLELDFALKALAKATNNEFHMAPDLEARLTFSGSFKAEDALDKMLENTVYDWTVQRGVLIVAEKVRLRSILDKFEQNLTALEGAPRATSRLDFVNCEFGYFLAACAKIMGLKVGADAPSEGSATCLTGRPAAESLALNCALQNPQLTLRVTGGTISFK